MHCNLFIIDICAIVCANTTSLKDVKVPQMLNESNFAFCLAMHKPKPDLAAIKKANNFSAVASFDLLLYLGVYAGKRYALLNATQQKAYVRFSERYWPLEAQLAFEFSNRSLAAPNASVTPGAVYGDAYKLCKGDDFCAALICHNMFRTLGRWRTAFDKRGTNYNPPYFKQNKAFFVQNHIKYQAAMITLDASYWLNDMDRFGS